MDAASAIVGIVSFGLIACQGLLKYYESCRSSNESIKTMCSNLEDLAEVLAVMDQIIKIRRADNVLQTDTALVVENAMKSCEFPLKKLRKKLDKVSSNNTGTGTADKLTFFGRKLQYPFKESTIIKIKHLVQESRDNLQLALATLNIDIASSSHEQLVDISQKIGSLSLDISLSHSRESRDAIARWLSSADYGSRQSDVARQRQAGAGQWFLTSPEFILWRDGSAQTLFCPGIPGSGKTVIASVAIDHLWQRLSGNDVAVTILYCDYQRRNEQDAASLLSSMLQQLMAGSLHVPQVTKDMYVLHHSRNTRPSISELCDSLNAVIARSKTTYLVVDAIDELNDLDDTRSVFLTNIRTLQQKHDLNILATSRHIGGIIQDLEIDFTLEIRADDADVEAYLESQLPRMTKSVRSSPNVWTLLKQDVVRGIGGMFLLARLRLESLTPLMTTRSIKDAMKNFSDGFEALDSAYNKAFSRIDSQPDSRADLARRVIVWITQAKRPWTSLELQQALAVTEGDKEIDQENFADIEELMSVCAGLVVFDHVSGLVRLVHHTLQEYLQRMTRRAWYVSLEAELASVCISYLSFKHWDMLFDFPSALANRKYLVDVKAEYTFMAYAVEYWPEHLRSSQHDYCFVNEQAVEFLRHDRFRTRSFVLTEDSSRTPRLWPVEKLKSFTALHYAALFGLHDLARRLIRETSLADRRDYRGFTPLAYAAFSGNTDTVRILLAKWGSDINIPSDAGYTPLFYAVQAGNPALVEELINAGADINHYSLLYGDIVQAVCRGRPDHAAEILEILLHRGARVSRNQSRLDPQNALYLAALSKRFDLVEMLLAQNSGPTQEDLSAALFAAISRADVKITKALLTAGADANARQHSETALETACKLESPAIAELLLDHDVEITRKDCCGKTRGAALVRAVERGNEATVALLLRSGADVNHREYSMSALEVAMWHGMDFIAQSLREAGAKLPPDGWRNDYRPSGPDPAEKLGIGNVYLKRREPHPRQYGGGDGRSRRPEAHSYYR